MKRTITMTLGFLWTGLALFAQIQSVNIAGSFSGSFLLSGSSEPYQIAGSPYLSESWMYGTIEMKSEALQSSSIQSDNKRKAIEKAILKCDRLIEKISDPRYGTEGVALLIRDMDDVGEGKMETVELLHGDFENLDELTGEVRSSLLAYLTQLRAGYEARIREFEKVNGLFRYNLYAQEFEMVYDRDTFAIIAPFNVQRISVSNMSFIHGFFVTREMSRTYLGSSYFQVLNEGECKLLVRHAVKISGGNAPVTYSWASAGGDAFVPYQQLYYQDHAGSEILELKKRRRQLRKIFGKHYDEVISFMKAEDLNLKKSDDLALLFGYYNNLDS